MAGLYDDIFAAETPATAPARAPKTAPQDLYGDILSEIDGTPPLPSAAPRPPSAPARPIEPGNIDLNNRPRVPVPGTNDIATVRSMTFDLPDGRAILVPSVSDDGRLMEPQEAIEYSKKTGKHLGIFRSAQEADAYAQQLHLDQERQYAKPAKGAKGANPPLPPPRPLEPTPPLSPDAEGPGVPTPDDPSNSNDLPKNYPSRDSQGRTSLLGVPNLTLEEGVDEVKGGVAAAEKQLAESHERLDLARKEFEKATKILGDRTPRPGSNVERQFLTIKSIFEKETLATEQATQNLIAARQGQAPVLTKGEDAARRAVDATQKGALGIAGGAALVIETGAGLGPLLTGERGSRTMSDAIHKTADEIGQKIAADPARAEEFIAQLGQGFGSTIPFVLGGYAGSALKIGSMATSGTLGALMQGDEGYQQAEKLGKKGWTLAAATIVSAGIGGTEAFGLGRLAELNKVTKGAVSRYFAAILHEKGEEGFQEGLQTLLENMRDRFLLKQEKPIEADVGRNALIGAILGGGIAAVAKGPQLAHDIRNPLPADLDPETRDALMRELMGGSNPFVAPTQPAGPTAPPPGAPNVQPNGARAPASQVPPFAPYAGGLRPNQPAGAPGGAQSAPQPDPGGSGAEVQGVPSDPGNVVGSVPGELGTAPLGQPGGSPAPAGGSAPTTAGPAPIDEPTARLLLGAGWSMEEIEDLAASPRQLALETQKAQRLGAVPFDGPLPVTEAQKEREAAEQAAAANLPVNEATAPDGAGSSADPVAATTPPSDANGAHDRPQEGAQTDAGSSVNPAGPGASSTAGPSVGNPVGKPGDSLGTGPTQNPGPTKELGANGSNTFADPGDEGMAGLTNLFSPGAGGMAPGVGQDPVSQQSNTPGSVNPNGVETPETGPLHTTPPGVTDVTGGSSTGGPRAPGPVSHGTSGTGTSDQELDDLFDDILDGGGSNEAPYDEELNEADAAHVRAALVDHLAARGIHDPAPGFLNAAVDRIIAGETDLDQAWRDGIVDAVAADPEMIADIAALDPELANELFPPQAESQDGTEADQSDTTEDEGSAPEGERGAGASAGEDDGGGSTRGAQEGADAGEGNEPGSTNPEGDGQSLQPTSTSGPGAVRTGPEGVSEGLPDDQPDAVLSPGKHTIELRGNDGETKPRTIWVNPTLDELRALPRSARTIPGDKGWYAWEADGVTHLDLIEGLTDAGVDTFDKVHDDGEARVGTIDETLAGWEEFFRNGSDEEGKLLDRLKAKIVVFASGMSRTRDLTAAGRTLGGLATRGVGLDINEISKPGIGNVARSIVVHGAQVFIDSGAFSHFKRQQKAEKAAAEATDLDALFGEDKPKQWEPLDFDQILAKYAEIENAIYALNDQEESYPRPLFVMPDIVGDQAGSIDLVEKYKTNIRLSTQFNLSKPIVPIQKGKGSLSDAWQQIVGILETDDFIVGIPANEKAVSDAELEQFVRDVNPKGIHFLGAAADSRLTSKLEALARAGWEGEHLSADGNILRGSLYGKEDTSGDNRAPAVEEGLVDKSPEFGAEVTGVPTLDAIRAGLASGTKTFGAVTVEYRTGPAGSFAAIEAPTFNTRMESSDGEVQSDFRHRVAVKIREILMDHAKPKGPTLHTGTPLGQKPEKEKIEDVGEKIGGARKDAWGKRGLTKEDLEGMTGAERAKHTTKENVWPRPDYSQLVADGMDANVAYLVKVIYDSLPTKPNKDAERDNYVDGMHTIRAMVEAIKDVDDAQGIYNQIYDDMPGEQRRAIMKEDRHGNRETPGRIHYTDLNKAKEEIAKGWPNMAPYLRLFEIRERTKWKQETRTASNGTTFTAAVKDGTEWIVLRKTGERVGTYPTQEEANAAAKAAYDKLNTKSTEGPQPPTRPHLDRVDRKGPDHRKGKDKTGQDFIDDFGFRGVEFGNWVANDERQKVVNLAYDALHDLAWALGVAPKALSLNGTLAVGFGSRGKGGKNAGAAHYEPDRTVINMTKLAGAGSLAHEWGHALDHYLGEVDSQNAYGGHPKSISRWRDTNVTQTTYGEHRHPLANLSPRLAEAARDLMFAIHFTKEDVASVEARLKALQERSAAGIASWQAAAENARNKLRDPNTTAKNRRKATARLREAESQVSIWQRDLEMKERDLLNSENYVSTDYYENAKKISGSGDYWHRPNELFARAFESFVNDQLADKDRLSQYLVQGVEPSRYGEGFTGNPYPAGSERRVINAGFNKLLDNVQLGENDKIEGKPGKIVEDEPVAIPSPAPQPTGEQEAAAVEGSETKTLESVFYEHLANGQKFENILVARRMAKDAGLGQDAKPVEEALEFAAVRLAREIVANAADAHEAFAKLLDLQDRMPKLGTRTSTSIREQAYSTPLALAYVASQLAGIHALSNVYEPTAGNGALLIEATPTRTSANEINPQRRANLAAQGFLVSGADAASLAAAPIPGIYDVVITNPPFGLTRNDKNQVIEHDLSDIHPGFATAEIDHVIALRALKGMKPTGRAVLIVGSVSPQGDRQRSYQSLAKMGFYKTLYEQYNVTEHFTVDGKLYAKQGASWPVDVIVIDGRGTSDLKLPAISAPPVLQSWGELRDKLNAPEVVAPAPRADSEHGGSTPNDGRDPTVALGSGSSALGNPNDGSGEVRGRDPAERPGNDRDGRGEGDQSGRRDERDGADRGPDPVSDDDLDKLFDETLGDTTPAPKPVSPETQKKNDDAFGPPPISGFSFRHTGDRKPTPKTEPAPAPRDKRSTKDVGKSAVKNAISAADEGMAGLTALFGGGKTIGSGPAFDEETYAKAKPLFLKAAQKFKEFANDVVELVKRMMASLQADWNWSTETLRGAKPYFLQFIKDVRDGVLKLTETKQEQETETQVAYTPKSGSAGMGTLVPVNLQQSIQDSLNDLEGRVGNLDDYVAKKLGYTKPDLFKALGAEQVDALALAIFNLEAGKGFIIGDQTGIGKGRVNAAIIRYAIHNNKIPVFVTEKGNLYGDMYRDLSATGIQDYLGRDISILMTNAGQTITLDDAGEVKLRSGTAREHNAVLAGAIPNDGGGLSAGGKQYDAVFTTYSQMQSIASNETGRRDFLRAIAPHAILIFDESHNAGGQGPQRQGRASTNGRPVAVGRSVLARELVANAAGVFYSSATYAKRPQVMDLYAATDMRLAVQDINQLGAAISLGGVPMQQAVASMLAKAGQYIRRERSFAGVTYDTPIVEVDKDQYESVCGSLAEINEFSRVLKQTMPDLVRLIIEETGGRPTGDNATSVSSITFSAVMHNVVSQLLLALKAKTAARMAIEAIERGEKPVLTVANTMEAFLKDYVENLGGKVGEPIVADFSNVLRRYLKRVRTVLVSDPQDPHAPPIRYYIPDHILGSTLLGLYDAAANLIERLNLDDLAISPIDEIKGILTEAGYKVGEITGRNLIIDYTAEEPTLGSRGTKESSINGRRKAIRDFQSGATDIMILNQSGATGLSLHASIDAADKRKRRMILVQPEANIDTHMQMLGRIHRTGQVVLPSYDQLVADIPAEKRPAAVLARKMASLNANTTANRGSALTAKDTVDFMNDYGDGVAAQWYADNPQLHRRLGNPLTVNPDTGRVDATNAIARITGRIPLLTLAEQEQIYEELETAYRDLIEQLDATGESALEAKTMDLKAKPLEESIVIPAREGETSPFAAAVKVVKAEISSTGHPMKPVDIVKRVMHELNHPQAAAVTEDNAAAYFVGLVNDPIRARKEEAERIETVRAFSTYTQTILDGMEDDTVRDPARVRFNAMRGRWETMHQALRIGERVILRTTAGAFTGIVLKIEHRGKNPNPLLLSSWRATFAVLDAARQVTFNFNALWNEGTASQDDAGAIEVGFPAWHEKADDTLNLYGSMQTEIRSNRFIVVGNLLAGFEWMKMTGRIINFTDETGTVRQGILAPRPFDLVTHNASTGQVASVEDIMRRVETERVLDDTATITLINRGNGLYQVWAPIGRNGRRLIQDTVMTAITGDFQSRSGRMQASIPDGQLGNVVNRLITLGYVFKTPATSLSTNDKGASFAKRAPNAPDLAHAQYGAIPTQAGSVEQFRIGNVGLEFDGGLTEASNRLDPIYQTLQLALEGILPKGVDIAVADRLTMRRGNMRGDYGSTVPEGDDEARDQTLGYMGGGINGGRIFIAIAAGPQNPHIGAVAFHEAWHAVKELLGVTAKDQKLLDRDRKRYYPMIRELLLQQGGTRESTTDEVLEGYSQREIEAHAAEAWAIGLRPTHAHSVTRRIIETMATIIARVRNWMKGYGLRVTDDIFKDFMSGKLTRQGEKRLGIKGPQEWVQKGGDAASFRPGTVQNIRSLNYLAGHVRPTPPNTNTFVTPKETRLDKVRAWQQDEFIYLEKVQAAIEEARGMALPQLQDAKLSQKLFSKRRNTGIKQFHARYVTPLVNAIKREGLSVEEVGLWLIAKHAEERNDLMAQRDPTRFGADGGSGLATQVAHDIITDLTPKSAALERIATRVYEIIELDRTTRHAAGLISDAELLSWEQMFPSGRYVPLRGFAAEEDAKDRHGLSGTGSGMDLRGRESKHALGRYSLPDNPLFSVIHMAEAGIVRAAKNDANQALLRLVRANPNKDLWEIIKRPGVPLPKRRYLDSHNMVAEMPDYWAPQADDVIGVKVAGQQYFIKLKNERLAKAYKDMGASALNLPMRYLNNFTRFYSRMQTGWNPEFFITNFTRDVQEALSTVKASGHHGATVKTFKNVFGKAFAASVAYQLGRSAGPQWDAIVRRWRQAGGEITSYDFKDLKSIQKDIENELETLQTATTKKAKLKKAGRVTHRYTLAALGKGLDGLNGAFENATRLAVFKAGIDSGLSDERAAALALDATIDFSTRGSGSTVMNALWGFYNVSVQGSTKSVTLLRNSRFMRRLWAGMFLAGIAQAVIGRLAFGDDDDDDEMTPYDKVRDWEKRSNLLIPYGTKKDKHGNTELEYVKIPLMFGLRIPHYLGERVAMVLMGAVKPGKAAFDVVENTLDAFNPVGSGSLLSQITPTIADWLVEPLANRNWQDRPIVPEPEIWTEGLPRSSQPTNRATNPLAIKAAEKANSLTGGNKFEAGWLDVYPGHIEYLVGWIAGGAGRFAANTYQTVTSIIDGVDVAPEKMPIARRFVGKTDGGGEAEVYYEKRGEEFAKRNQYNKSKSALENGVGDQKEAEDVLTRRSIELGVRPRAGKRTEWKKSALAPYTETDKALKELRQEQSTLQPWDPRHKDIAQEIQRMQRDARVMHRAITAPAPPKAKPVPSADATTHEEVGPATESLWSSVKTMLGGNPDPITVETEKPNAYPTDEDAQMARKAGFGYGEDQDFVEGNKAQVLGKELKVEKFVPGTGKGKKKPQTRVESTFVPVQASGDIGELARSIPEGRTKLVPTDEKLQNTMTKASLAANRNAIAALGIDNRRVAFDTQSKVGNVNYAGSYDPPNDTSFSVADADSNVVHEAVHRGLRMVAKRRPDLVQALWASVDDEYVVRHIMRTVMGNPEESRGSPQVGESRFHFETSPKARKNQALLKAVEDEAAKMIAERRPRGPR